MKQKLLNLKSWLLICLMMVGVNAWAGTYEKVTSAPSDWSGEYVVTVQSEENLLAWTGIDAGQCREAVTLTGGKIESTSLVTITVEALTDGGYSVKVKGGANDGKYISSGTSAPTFSNGLKFVDKAHRVDFAMDENGCVTMTQTISGNSDASKNGTMYLLYNNNSGTSNERFRFYKESNYENEKYLTPILYKKAVSSETINVTGISLDKTELELMAGESAVLTATLVPEDATNQNVVWVSNNDRVATVDDNGKVTAVAEGTTTITVVSEDGEFEATCTVKVNPYTAPTSGVIYKWDGTGSTSEAVQEGGTASVPIESGTNMVAGSSQKGNYCFKMNKGYGASGGPYVILVTLNSPLKAGDVITGAVFRASETAATFGMDLNATSEMTTTIQYTLADPQVLSSNGTPEDNISWTVPAEADGCRYIRLYRASGSTGLYVSKLVVTRPATKGTIDIVAKGLMPGYSDIAPELDFYFATFSSDKDVIIEGGYDLDLFGVYTVSVDPEEGVVSVVDPEDISMAEVTDEEIMAEDGFVTGYYVPANTGVLVISMGNQATYYYVAESESNYLAEIDPDGTNMLQPASKDKSELPNHKFYKLAYSDSNMEPASLGFYYGAADGAAFTSREGSAYLAVPADAANVKGFRFVADDATAIKEVQNAECRMQNGVYNLAGQRVAAKDFKGIVIKNGKKMLNK